MANEIRLRQNFISGTITDNPLTSGATTVNSAALAALVAIGSASHAVLILDPRGVSGAPEIVHVTAHTASATSATIVRGREGTTARQHASGTAWAHGPIASDFDLNTHSIPKPHAYDDNFADGSGESGAVNGLAGKWSLRTLTSGLVKVSAADVQGGLFIDNTGGSAVSGTWGLEQSVTLSGDFTLVARMGIDFMSEREMIGIHAVDSSGNGWSVSIDSGDVSYLRHLASNAASGAAAATPVNGSHLDGYMVRLILRRVSNTWYGGVLKDDVMLPINARFTSSADTLTVAKIGIGRYFGSGTCRVFVDYFRVTE